MQGAWVQSLCRELHASAKTWHTKKKKKKKRNHPSAFGHTFCFAPWRRGGLCDWLRINEEYLLMGWFWDRMWLLICASGALHTSRSTVHIILMKTTPQNCAAQSPQSHKWLLQFWGCPVASKGLRETFYSGCQRPKNVLSVFQEKRKCGTHVLYSRPSFPWWFRW